MKWEDKIEMVKLHNSNDTSGFQKFVIDHLDEFDIQAFDMFINITELIPSNIMENKDFYIKIYNKTKDLDLDFNDSFRYKLRMSAFNTLCKENF